MARTKIRKNATFRMGFNRKTRRCFYLKVATAQVLKPTDQSSPNQIIRRVRMKRIKKKHVKHMGTGAIFKIMIATDPAR